VGANPGANLDQLQVPTADLKHYRRNARVGNVDLIAESLQVNGQYRPIVVNRRTSEVLAGNHTLKAARQLGWETIAATFVDVDDEAAARIVLVDNRSNDVAGYDDRALAEILKELDSLAGTGFDAAALDELLASLTPEEKDLDEAERIPATPQADPICKVGDVWLLGEHRLVVGDSTDPDVLAEALDGETAEMVLTDPPYNVAYRGKTSEAMTIDNDDMTPEAFAEFLGKAMRAMYVHAAEGAPIYVFYATAEEIAFRQALVDAGWLYKQNLVWIKDRFVLSRQDYHWQHEPILYGWKPGAAHKWFGGFTPTTVIDDQKPIKDMTKAELRAIVEQAYEQTTTIRADRPARNVDHPTAKPIVLLAKLLENSSRLGTLVLDPFGGSGATLIACDYLGRRAATVELDPVYADVICRRYQEFAGVKPVLAATGEPHDFTPEIDDGDD
jgi:DNA modification methylase